MSHLRVLSRTCAACLLVLLAPIAVNATTITFDLGYMFDQNPPTTMATPYLQATFSDHEGGGVDLVMTAVNLPSGAYVGDWFFNTTVANPSLLTFTYVAGAQASVTVNSNKIHSGNIGDYDISFVFPSSQSSPNRFGATSSSTYLITGQNVTAESFVSLADRHGQTEQLYTVANIGGTGNVGWTGAKAYVTPPAPPVTTVPEPGAMTLLMAGSALLFAPKLIARLRR